MTAAPSRGWQRSIALFALVATTALAVLTLHEGAVGRDAVAAADAAAARSDWRESIAQARTAAEALAPGSPWPERGLRRLEAIGHDAEARGEDPVALLAYGAIRTAALETRAPGTWSDRWRRTAEEGLVRVATASKEVPRPRPALIREALLADPSPSPWRLAAMSLAGLATLGALAALALIDGPSQTIRAAQSIAAVGFLVYAAALWGG
jgi:hypothetical protein